MRTVPRLSVCIAVGLIVSGACHAAPGGDVGVQRPTGMASQDPHHQYIADGIVDRYLLDPRGDIEGILLTDGTQMHVTSRIVTALTKAIKPGHHVRVEGVRKQGNKLISPDVIQNVTTGGSFSVPLGLDLPLLPLERLAMTELKAAGTIVTLLYNYMDGSVQGMLLSDGTQVRFPPDVGDDFRRSLKVGDRVDVECYGTENQYGRALEAGAMSANGGPLTPLDITLHRLP